jgi:hypothetical protein
MAFTVDTDQWATDAALLESALAAERRATVERIRAANIGMSVVHGDGQPALVIPLAILDEEAARVQ